MIYTALKWLMRIVLQVYFKQIYISGKKWAEHTGPTILACNHPNSFLDAVLLAILINQPLHFLARSDVFNTPLKRWILAKMHVIPIYRLEEGAENLSKNQETFTHCYKILQNNGTVLIFSEGICVLEKRLRPLRKGTARLAFGAEEFNTISNLKVVAVTLNYTYPTRFREEVIIGISEPLWVKDYAPLYQEAPAKAINLFTRALAIKLKSNLINVEQPKLEEITEILLPIIRTNIIQFDSGNWLNISSHRLSQEKEATEKIYQLFTNNPDGFTSFKMELTEYQQYLETYHLADAVIAGTKFSIDKKIFLFLGLPFFLIGLFLNGLPIVLADVITKIQVKKIEFFSSVRVVLGFLLYLIYYLILILATILISPGKFLYIAAALPLSGYLALVYYDAWKELAGIKNINPKVLYQLKNLRSSLLAKLYG